MKKPLTFCLLTTVGLIVLGALDHITILTLDVRTYLVTQILLAAFSASIALHHLTQRYRKTGPGIDPLIFGIIAGTLAAVLATKNAGLGAVYGGAGSMAVYVALGATVLNALLCLIRYVELDSAAQTAEHKGPMRM